MLGDLFTYPTISQAPFPAFDLMFDDDDDLLELETEQQASAAPPLPQAASNQNKNE